METILISNQVEQELAAMEAANLLSTAKLSAFESLSSSKAKATKPDSPNILTTERENGGAREAEECSSASASHFSCPSCMEYEEHLTKFWKEDFIAKFDHDAMLSCCGETQEQVTSVLKENSTSAIHLLSSDWTSGGKSEEKATADTSQVDAPRGSPELGDTLNVPKKLKKQDALVDIVVEANSLGKTSASKAAVDETLCSEKSWKCESDLNILDTLSDKTSADIDIDSFSDDDFQLLLAKLQENTYFASLGMSRSSNRRSDQDVRLLFAVVKDLPKLRTLSLLNFGPMDGTGADDDEDLDAVVSMLQKVPHLETLRLGVRSGTIPDLLLRTIGDRLVNLKVLYLHLHESCKLSEIVKYNLSLKELYVVENSGPVVTIKEFDDSTNDTRATIDRSLQDGGNAMGENNEKLLWTTGHCLSLLSALSSTKRLRVLDLGSHIGLSTMCVQLWAKGIQSVPLETFSFSYEPDSTSLLIEQAKVNNELFESFRRALIGNKTLKAIKNHASSKVYVDESSIESLKQMSLPEAPSKEMFDFCNKTSVQEIIEEESIKQDEPEQDDILPENAGCCSALACS